MNILIWLFFGFVVTFLSKGWIASMGILLAVSLLVYFERKDAVKRYRYRLLRERKDAVERYRLLLERKDAGDITFPR